MNAKETASWGSGIRRLVSSLFRRKSIHHRKGHQHEPRTVSDEQLAIQLLEAVIDDDTRARRAASHRIDAENSWRRVAHYLAGVHAGYREAHLYRLDTGRCLRDDTDNGFDTALPALTAVA
jgi:hypothetical protein